MENTNTLNPYKNNSTFNQRLSFMFKKISASKTSLAYWLTIPEFESAMISRLDNKDTIDNRIVLDVMKGIYSEWEHLRESSEEKPAFNYSLARRGIHQIEKAIAEGE